MKKKDFILIAVIIAAAIIMYAFIFSARSVDGGTLLVTVDGEEYGRYSLSEDNTIEIKTDYGTNVLIIKDGYAYMEDADCPDKYCIEQGKINKNTETIVCLPHRVVAEVVNAASDADVDAILG